MTSKCIEWLKKDNSPSPKIVVDLTQIKNNFLRFKKLFPDIKPYYAVKANPHKKVISVLNKLNCYFDCASIAEIKNCISKNVAPEKISFGNTIKKEVDILIANGLGIKMFAFDSLIELKKIAKKAKGSKVFCRIQVPNGGAQWPLSKKFGCSPNEAVKLLNKASELNLIPLGISFHVGSQQISYSTWNEAIKIASKIYKKMSKNKIYLDFLNMGGGIPATYSNYQEKDMKAYSEKILNSLNKYFGNFKPSTIIMEPGRYFVADAGVIETEIILISTRNNRDKIKWIYLDVGRYNGLAETEAEAIKYPIEARVHKKDKKEKYVLAGPSCDSHDVIYEKHLCLLPKSLKVGDKLWIFSSGAYTTVYASKFNGIRNMREFYIK